jgi:hypothetical protein
MKEICFRISVALTVLTLTGLAGARPDAAHGLEPDARARGDTDHRGRLRTGVGPLGAVQAYQQWTRRDGVRDPEKDRDHPGSDREERDGRDRGPGQESQGTLLWQQTLNGGIFDSARSVAVDSRGTSRETSSAPALRRIRVPSSTSP